jgi:hypothetical protein
MKQNINYINHSKAVFEKMFEDKISPLHISMYNSLFYIWNKSGFDTEINIVREEVMKFSKIGSANTYTKTLKELHSLGYIKYFPSHNPLKCSQVTLIKFDNTTNNSTDISTNNTISKGSNKGDDNTDDTIYKLLNNKTIKLIKDNFELVEINLEKWIDKEKIYLGSKDSELRNSQFENFWNYYKKGSKKITKEKFIKLNDEDLEKIKKHLPLYFKANPEHKFRKDAERYLSNRLWENNDEDLLLKLSNPINNPSIFVDTFKPHR